MNFLKKWYRYFFSALKHAKVSSNKLSQNRTFLQIKKKKTTSGRKVLGSKNEDMWQSYPSYVYSNLSFYTSGVNTVVFPTRVYELHF